MNLNDTNTVIAYTDGSCLGNPGPGGWAVYMVRGNTERTLFGGEEQTNNNRMELMAPLKAIRSMKTHAPLIIRTDSRYVADGMTRWLQGWVEKGWRKADGKPVANADLWQQLIDETAKRQVSWEWVKGHANDDLNNKVDGLARQEAEKMKTRR